ncbi:MAG: hypothetical protein SFW36_09970 [Leptolyngbyaceae cyanobacterium bins.59]|nr:hypothetical protein [Leptolyngbyaceae cyanobacterium bins.59]
MTQFPDDDLPLTAFLRQNRSTVPPAAIDFEDRLMATIAAPQPIQQPRSQWRQQLRWAVPTTIAASLLIAIGSYQWMTPKTPTEADLAKLEAFMQNSWEGSVPNTSGTETLSLEMTHSEPSL